jgi:polysaccharide deacetylase 2 family uncharacterized protein YibQ
MPPRKKSKTRTKSGKTKPSKTPRLMIAALVILAVTGIVAVKYFQTSEGRAQLLDAGFHGYYAQVQMDIGDGLRRSLAVFGLRGRVDERAEIEHAGGKTVRILEWRIVCDESFNYVQINVALTKAVRENGGIVRHSEETDGGDKFLFTVGTHRYDTHRLVFSRSAPAVSRKPDKSRPKLALVIDDFGYSRNGLVKDMLALDLPLTIAVLPSLPYSTYALERAQEKGKCTILHLPMEPDENQGGDIEMVTTDMQPREIEQLVERYIRSLPGIEGVNNHQGSRATCDRRVMDIVLTTIKSHGLFFLDSLTSAESVAYNVAREMGVPTARNDLFIDADTEDAAIVERRIRQLVTTARKRGTAVGIGHPRRWTLEALKNSEMFLKEADVELVFLNDLVDQD